VVKSDVIRASPRASRPPFARRQWVQLCPACHSRWTTCQRRFHVVLVDIVALATFLLSSSVVESGRWAPRHRWLHHKAQTSAGRWIFCMTSSVTAGASAFSPSSTISPASAWRWWPIPRCRACASGRARRNVAERGKPAAGVSDNGTELTSTAILRWSQESRVEWHCIAPNKAQQNAFYREFSMAVCVTSG
jgi:hypothetical protein